MQEFDVLIIGGGVIGLSIARELKKNGVERVAILEKKHLFGNESSFAAAGMLAPQAEANQADDFFYLCQQSRDLFPTLANELLEESQIDIRLDQSGTLYLAFTEKDLAEIEKRFEWQKEVDLPVEKLSREEILKDNWHLSPKVLGALRFPLDWQVDNRNLVEALHIANQKLNVQLELETKVEKILFKSNGKIEIATSKGDFISKSVVLASGAWTSQLKFPFELGNNLSVKPIRGQMLSFVVNEKLFQEVIYTPRGYIVPRYNRVLVGATVEDINSFDKEVTAGGIFSLLETLFEIAPNAGFLTFFKSWAGLRPKTPDGLPSLGEFPENSGLYFATGHYRNGILLAPITGKLIAERIAKGVDSPFLQIFNPSRFLNNS